MSAAFLQHRRRRSKGRCGFTLVEVLVTLLLMFIVLPVALEAMKLSTRAGSVARRKTEAAGLAESKLNEIVAIGDYQVMSGDFGVEWEGYRWTAVLDSWSNAGVQVTGLQQLTVTVAWGEGVNEQSVVLSTLVRPVSTGTSSAFGSSGTSTGSTP